MNERRRLIEHEGHIHAVKRGWRGRFNLENMPWLIKSCGAVMRAAFIYRHGVAHACELVLEYAEFEFDNLPEDFDGTKILLISDTHIDAFSRLKDNIFELTRTVEYDFCVLGGDYRFGYRRENDLAYSRMEELAETLCQRSKVFGVLGNHDKYRMARLLEKCGVEMLINDCCRIEKNGSSIFIAGLDDCHYYGADDIESASEGKVDGEFSILISHSPEPYKHAAKRGFSLYLAGHTHGGQVCLPGGIALVRGTSIPRKLMKGKWSYRGMSGYTSRGVGTSGMPVRFFCYPEIAVLTLRRRVQISD